eukprot:593778-Pelagomonas_calceolata.AAC.7
MVAAAKAANLALMTYGRENNEPENVRQQAKLGVKGAILDEVSDVKGWEIKVEKIVGRGYALDNHQVGFVFALAAGETCCTGKVRVLCVLACSTDMHVHMHGKSAGGACGERTGKRGPGCGDPPLP